MNARSKHLWGALAATLALAACETTDPAPPDAGVIVQDPCTQDSECDLGLRCSPTGACEEIPPCSLDSECRRYEYCSVSEGICRTRDGFGSPRARRRPTLCTEPPRAPPAPPRSATGEAPRRL